MLECIAEIGSSFNKYNAEVNDSEIELKNTWNWKLGEKICMKVKSEWVVFDTKNIEKWLSWAV